MMFTMYAGPDSGFSSPVSLLPSCSAFDPRESPSFCRIRRRLSYESIDTPATRDASTQTESELSESDRAKCRRVALKLRAMCDDFDREFFQPAKPEAAPSCSYSDIFGSLLRRLCA